MGVHDLHFRKGLAVNFRLCHALRSPQAQRNLRRENRGDAFAIFLPVRFGTPVLRSADFQSPFHGWNLVLELVQFAKIWKLGAILGVSGNHPWNDQIFDALLAVGGQLGIPLYPMGEARSGPHECLTGSIASRLQDHGSIHGLVQSHRPQNSCGFPIQNGNCWL